MATFAELRERQKRRLHPLVIVAIHHQLRRIMDGERVAEGQAHPSRGQWQ